MNHSLHLEWESAFSVKKTTNFIISVGSKEAMISSTNDHESIVLTKKAKKIDTLRCHLNMTSKLSKIRSTLHILYLLLIHNYCNESRILKMNRLLLVDRINTWKKNRYVDPYQEFMFPCLQSQAEYMNRILTNWMMIKIAWNRFSSSQHESILEKLILLTWWKDS